MKNKKIKKLTDKQVSKILYNIEKTKWIWKAYNTMLELWARNLI